MSERSAESAGFASARRAFYVLGSTGLVVAALYLGQRIFVALALAVLLTLVLSPVVSRLERAGFWRFPAVLSVVCLAFSLTGLVAWAVASQFAGLVADLPQHKSNLRDKIAQLRGGNGPGLLGTIQEFLAEIENAGGTQPGTQTATPVIRVEPQKPSLFAQLQSVASRVLGNVTLLVAVILLVITLLLYREDTRNRLIRLTGRGRLTVTTRALDEAGRRLGGYLLGHSAVNAGFGIAIGLGLTALGVPYSALWGLLAGALRFVPSVGVWLVAPLPAFLALVSGPGFTPPLLVLALFLVLDLITTNLVEPWVCGRSVGLAPVPLLLAVMFWTGLWGIIGLVLATPLTVCLAVLGKYVPQLGFLSILLSQEAALRPAARYYQRLLARDRYEAEVVVKEYLADHPVEELLENVLLPALVLVRRDRRTGELRPEDEAFVLGATREIADGLSASAAPMFADSGTDGRVAVVGIPAADAADEAALHLLRPIARAAGADVAFADGLAATAPEGATSTVVIAALGPQGLTEACYVCRRLRSQHSGVRILVGRWGRARVSEKARRRLLAAGASRVVATLREAATELVRTGHSALPVGYPETA
jgi:predicted PurR-regulated permease PerM